MHRPREKAGFCHDLLPKSGKGSPVQSTVAKSSCDTIRSGSSKSEYELVTNDICLTPNVARVTPG